MLSQLDLLKQMASVLERLVENAKKLNEGVNLKVAQRELEELQEKQHEILHELGQLDLLLKQSAPGGPLEELDRLRLRNREKLAHFQTINEEFFQRLNSHTRVIEKSQQKDGMKKELQKNEEI